VRKNQISRCLKYFAVKINTVLKNGVDFGRPLPIAGRMEGQPDDHAGGGDGYMSPGRNGD
jgi:hypothetical protein